MKYRDSLLVNKVTSGSGTLLVMLDGLLECGDLACEKSPFASAYRAWITR